MNIKRALLMSGACGILATAVSTALAQQTSEVAEVVIVTGSYIRGTAEDAALPVDVISAEDLAKQGSPSTLEMIKDLSVSNGVLGDTNQFDARAQGTEGSGSVNLRGFGPQRTLVLLNGRRMVTSPFLLGAVDTNFIPLAAIGRVEVLKDGAAATYGSDAIGGVVNFITKENLRGVDVGADFKQIEDSDGDYTRQRRLRLGQRSYPARCSRSATSTARSCWCATATGRPRNTWRIRRAAGRPPATRTRSFRWAPRARRSPALRAIRSARRWAAFPGVTATGCAGLLLAVLGVRRADRRGRSLAGLRGLQPRHHRVDQLPHRGDVRRHGDPDLPDLAFVRGAAGSDLDRNRRHLGRQRPVLRAATNPGFAPFLAANPGVFPGH